MNDLARRIAELITADGPLSVAQYMTICLHDPKAGAYAARHGIGRDFTTSPEISQTFGEMVGLWVVQCWHDQGRPANPRLIELGPGRGTLMSDALRAVQAAAPEFLLDGDIVLVEASAALKAAQQEKLKTSSADISWEERLDPALAERPLFFVANEFFDCLPVRQFVKTERGWCERLVTVENDKLAFALAPVPFTGIPPDRADAPDGAVYEVAPSALALAEQIGQAVNAKGGAALIVDYGYDAPGVSETLQAVANSRYVDVLGAPGDSDLSAHVDFPALAAAGAEGGASVFGPVTQCNFLADLGIGPRAERLMIANPLQARDIATAVDRLVNPELMGALFKALAFAPKSVTGLPGFNPPAGC